MSTTDSQSPAFGPLINDQYRITKRLGGGSFGDIYLAVGQTGEKVAVKFEKHSTRCPQLRHEYKVYRELQNCQGFGRVYYFGIYNNYNAMVMDLLGPSLEDLFTKCGRRFSLKTVLQLAEQLLERMDAMHSRHLVHRDVKPANFVFGPGKGSQTCFSIDFGLSTRYRHPRTLQHIPYREGRSLTGTPRYASINNHLGVEQSRRDDLESVGYVLIYFLKGSLPWQGLKARNAKRKYKMILERKQAISIQQLCQGLPQQFAEYLAYCRSLKFEAKPNVSYLRGLFRELYKAQGYGSAEREGSPIEWDWTKYETADPPASSGASVTTGEDAADKGVSSGKGALERKGETGTRDEKGQQGYPESGRVGTPSAGVGDRTHEGKIVEGKRRSNAGPAPDSSRGPAVNSGTAHEDEDGGGGGPLTSRSRRGHTSNGVVGRQTGKGQSGGGGGRATGPSDIGRDAVVGEDCVEREASAAVRKGHDPQQQRYQHHSYQRPSHQQQHEEEEDQQQPGGWSMWNLRPKTSGGGFWGGGMRGWSNKDHMAGGEDVGGHGVADATVTNGGGVGAVEGDDRGGAGSGGVGTAHAAGPGQHGGGTGNGRAGPEGTKAGRPHTAHGARGVGTDAVAGGSKAAGASPVVAGARGMMRYREEQRQGVGGVSGAWGGGTSTRKSFEATGQSGSGGGAGYAGYSRPSTRTSATSAIAASAGAGASAGWGRSSSGVTGASGYPSGLSTSRPGTSGTGLTRHVAGSSSAARRDGGAGGGPGGGAGATKVRQRPTSASRGLVMAPRRRPQY